MAVWERYWFSHTGVKPWSPILFHPCCVDIQISQACCCSCRGIERFWCNICYSPVLFQWLWRWFWSARAFKYKQLWRSNLHIWILWSDATFKWRGNNIVYVLRVSCLNLTPWKHRTKEKSRRSYMHHGVECSVEVHKEYNPLPILWILGLSRDCLISWFENDLLCKTALDTSLLALVNVLLTLAQVSSFIRFTLVKPL